RGTPREMARWWHYPRRPASAENGCRASAHRAPGHTRCGRRAPVADASYSTFDIEALNHGDRDATTGGSSEDGSVERRESPVQLSPGPPVSLPLDLVAQLTNDLGVAGRDRFFPSVPDHVEHVPSTAFLQPAALRAAIVRGTGGSTMDEADFDMRPAA